ncbi:IclR family transcriptional regulator [Streptomyces sp. 7-21]|uniref:IclR family transcriptional regulator n=1 Tax=Streptomyces sp. 7-21 TaxID=2802283 RepID=UPI00191D3963|nr:helix-turn-helix domain-containing protein [Streptomyces sp. 7-21]MBL1068483.1 helix-turn-helix domain-containing protein [Streptomyces sp. 7-21]
MTAETSQTLDRGLRVLKLLAGTDRGLTVTELSRRLGVNRTVVYRLLATLEQHALVRRDAGGRARVGVGVLGLGRQVHPLVREAALPALRELADDVGATAHLTVADGNEAMAIAVAEPSWTDYHVAYRPGIRHPLEHGAAGQAILAARCPDMEREGGFVVGDGEIGAGVTGTAAALPPDCGIEGSVGVVMFNGAAPSRVGPRVVRAAEEVAALLR